ERHGHISKEGNRMVRALLVQATLSAIRHTGGPVRRQYLGVVKRRGKQIARIAATAKLLGVLFQMMKQGVTYEELHQRGGSAQCGCVLTWSVLRSDRKLDWAAAPLPSGSLAGSSIMRPGDAKRWMGCRPSHDLVSAGVYHDGFVSWRRQHRPPHLVYTRRS